MPIWRLFKFILRSLELLACYAGLVFRVSKRVFEHYLSAPQLRISLFILDAHDLIFSIHFAS